jgi:hypothetical protein
MVRIAFSPWAASPQPPCHSEKLCRFLDTGKKLPFVNADRALARLNLVNKFLEFDNRNY